MYWLLLSLPFVMSPAAIWLYIRFNPQFGGRLRQQDVEAFARSKHWDGKVFNNLAETRMDMSLSKIPQMIAERMRGGKVRRPAKLIPILPLNQERFLADPQLPKFVWYGHSVLLLQVGGKNFLIDPMLGDNTTPVGPFTSKRFSEKSLEVIAQLPPIDAILLTHDHYDHLDYSSIQLLRAKCTTWWVALGVKRHLERWGIDAGQVKEFDWWETAEFEGVQITFTPSRHFSGRGLSDRFKSLWGGWVFSHGAHRIYWSGDGGEGAHFKEVGDRLGPFDWAFLECGQYNPNWHAIHMYPEECVQAGQDARARWSVPVHWGGFELSMHPWKEPVERFAAAAQASGLGICTPEIGRVMVMGEESETTAWWTELD